MQKIQKVQLKPQEGPEDVDGYQLRRSWMQKRKVQGTYMQEVQKCWEHVKTRADEIFSKSQFSHSVEVGAAGRLSRRPQRSHGRIQRRGDARVQEREEKQSTEHVKGSSV